MKIAFFSSVLNHHQISFCDEMYNKYGKDFTFISTMEIEQQRVALGYSLFEREYQLKMHTSEENRKKAEAIFQDADIVILGVFLEDWLKSRMKKGKITFLYKERLFKEKPSAIKWLRSLLFVMREYYPFRNKSLYMLAASAFAYDDYKSLGFFKNKTFNWGYFPPKIEYNLDELFNKKSSDKKEILWAGRFIDWKHPEFVLEAGKELKEKGYEFHINMIGNGPLLKDMQEKSQEYKLQDYVTFTDSMPPEKVREYMERASIYLFTSGRGEGFGAVLFEAMNSGCAVVASETAGSTKLLVKDKNNGRIYYKDSVDEMISCILELINSSDNIKQLGNAAYKTIDSIFNAKCAAERFCAVAEAIFKKEELPNYDFGPMSKVE